MAFINSGKKGKRASDVKGVLSTGEQFNQQNYLIPTITGYSVTGDSDYEADDLAVDTAGGQTIILAGSGFKSGAQVVLDGSTIGSVTVTDSSISFEAPAKTGGTYTVYVTNPSGGTAALTPGILYSGTPTWSTPAAGAELGPYYETTSYLDSFVATNSDDGSSPIVYSLYDGAFPTGATLDSNAGTLSGTAPVDAGSTTYSFTIKATDSDQQDTLRSFTLTVNADVVTWSSPSQTQNLALNSQISPLTLLATSAAGYVVSYAADSLPTGLSLADDSISGTPTVAGSSYTTLTATAATTGRTADRLITWTISVSGDTNFGNVNFLIQADTSGASTSNSNITDASSNAISFTTHGDPNLGSLSPYVDSAGDIPSGYDPDSHAGSVYLDGTGDTYSSTASNTHRPSGDFTIECWIKLYTIIDTSGIFTIGNTSNNNANIAVRPKSSGGLGFWVNGFSSETTTAGSLLSTDTWYHVALVRNGSTNTLYLDGTSVASNSNTPSFSGTTYIAIGRKYGDNTSIELMKGYMSDFRYTKSAVYTSSFTPPTTGLSSGSAYVHLPLNDARLYDGSTKHNILLFGSPTVDTSIKKFGTGSIDFGSSSSNYIHLYNGELSKTGTTLQTGTGDFTLEWWMYCNSGTGRSLRVAHKTGYIIIADTTNTYGVMNTVGAGDITVGYTNIIDASSSITAQTWTYCALVRSSGTYTLYQGTSGSVTNVGSSSTGGTDNFTISEWGRTDQGLAMNGYLDDIRFTKGVARTITSVPSSAFIGNE